MARTTTKTTRKAGTDDNGQPLSAPAAAAAGRRIRTKVADCDTDTEGRERVIPVGTLGTVQPEADGLFDILWDNGGWTRWTAEELARDAEAVEGGAQ